MVYSKAAIVFLLIPIGFLSVSVYERYQKERETREKRIERSEELLLLQEQAKNLEEKVNAAESERGIEAEIRSRYDVAKEGEQVVIIIDEEADNVQDIVEASEVERRSFFDRLKFWQ